MNYLKELNEMFVYCILNKLSKSETILMHVLYLINNKKGWRTWFEVDNETIQRLMGGYSRESLNEARNKLKQRGRIDFKQGIRNKKTAEYSLISFSNISDIQVDKEVDIQVDIQVDKEVDIQVDTSTKQNKTKQNKEKTKEKKSVDEKIIKPKKSEAKTLDDTLESVIANLKCTEKLKNAFREFVLYRKSNVPMTEVALKKLIIRLDAFGYTESQKMECLDNSIINAWRGVFKLNKHAQIIKYNQEKEASQIKKFGGTYI